MSVNPFPRVKEAREALKTKALEIYESYLALALQAAADKDYETSEKIQRFLIEHMPAEDGVRLIDSSAAKPKEIDGPKGPSIQIGIALGGVNTNQPKLLPTIDITPEKDPE